MRGKIIFQRDLPISKTLYAVGSVELTRRSTDSSVMQRWTQWYNCLPFKIIINGATTLLPTRLAGVQSRRSVIYWVLGAALNRHNSTGPPSQMQSSLCSFTLLLSSRNSWSLIASCTPQTISRTKGNSETRLMCRLNVVAHTRIPQLFRYYHPIAVSAIVHYT